MPLEDTVRFINGLLRKNDIKHFYFGGIVASTHGEPRATKDADIVVLVDPKYVEGLIEMIEDAGLHVWNRRRVLEKLTQGKTAKINWDRKFSFDLRVASYTLDEYALNRAEDVYIKQYKETLRMATPEDLIVYKLARFDDQDHVDIKSVIAVQRSLDWPYIQKRAKELGIESNRPEMMERFAVARSWSS